MRVAIKKLLLAFGATLFTGPALAQQIAASEIALLPDAPSFVSAPIAEPSLLIEPDNSQFPKPQQTKRILGIVPNFRAVDADTTLPPQTVREKLTVGLQDSFDYSSFVFVGLQAGTAQASQAYPAFHEGAAGFGRYYWHTFADQADENLWVESTLPAALHEDSRYYTLGRGGFVRRAGYALSRVVITRTDSGDETFNVAEIIGSGTAAGISSAYYPGQYRIWTKTGQRWLTSLVLDGATFAIKEFWPDLNNSLLRHKG